MSPFKPTNPAWGAKVVMAPNTGTGPTSDVRWKTSNGDGGTADQLAAANTKREEARYQEIYRPVNRDLIQELDRNRLLQAAQDEAAKINSVDSTLSRASREVRRRGGQLTAQQTERIGSQVKLQDAQDYSFTVDNARLKQREFNDNLRTQIVNTGRGISTSGNNLLQDAANSEAQRNAANSQARAANKAAKQQMLGTAIGVGAMLLL